MSIEAINLVRKLDMRPSGMKFVAICLANYADEEWGCYPSVAKIMAFTCQGEKTVREHLNALEGIGFITRKRKRRTDGTLTGYRFKIQRQFSPVAKSAASPATGEKGQKPPAKSAGQEPSIEPSEDISPKKPDGKPKETVRGNLETILSAEMAEEVIQHRRRIGKAMTPFAAKRLAAKFAQTANPDESAAAMIEHGWQGFEPAWLENRRGKSGESKAVRMIDSFARAIQQ